MKTTLIDICIGFSLGQVAGAFIFSERVVYALWIMVISGAFIALALSLALRMRP
jgi:hypothetical protein